MADGDVLALSAFGGLSSLAAGGSADTGLSIKQGVRALEIDLIRRAWR